MRIKKLELKNFRGFEELTIDFPEEEGGLAVFVGVNGAGKTSILDGIGSGLREVQEGLKPKSRDRSGSWINESDIRLISHKLGSKTTYEKQSDWKIETHIEINNNEISWCIHSGGGNNELIRKFTENLKTEVFNGKKNEIPLILYYNVQRYWSHEKLNEIELYPIGSRLETYVDCLNPEVSTQRLYEWFKRMKIIQFENDNGELPPELKAVRLSIVEAIKAINLKNDKKTNITFSVKNDELEVDLGDNKPIYFRLLSDGLRNTLGMIGDIAYRMAELNPHLTNETKGIVLIDEIDLHLHPFWQRVIVKTLRKIFPNIQFILTTHSPQVLSTLKKENVFILDDFKLVKDTPHTMGRDSNSILYDIFGVEKRPAEAKKEFNRLYRNMDDPKKVQETENMLRDVEEKYGYYDEEVVRARAQFHTLNEG